MGRSPDNSEKTIKIDVSPNDGDSLKYDSASDRWKPATDAKYIKFTKTYADFIAAAVGNTSTVILQSIPAGTMIERWITHHTAAFTGGAISYVALSINPGSYIGGSLFSDPIDGADVDADATNMSGFEVNFNAAVNVELAITTTDANVSALTSGSIDVWLKLVRLV